MRTARRFWHQADFSLQLIDERLQVTFVTHWFRLSAQPAKECRPPSQRTKVSCKQLPALDQSAKGNACVWKLAQEVMLFACPVAYMQSELLAAMKTTTVVYNDVKALASLSKLRVQKRKIRRYVLHYERVGTVPKYHFLQRICAHFFARCKASVPLRRKVDISEWR